MPPKKCDEKGWCVLDKGHPGVCVSKATLEQQASEAVSQFQGDEWYARQETAKGGKELVTVDDLLDDIFGEPA